MTSLKASHLVYKINSLAFFDNYYIYKINENRKNASKTMVAKMLGKMKEKYILWNFLEKLLI